MSSKGALVVIGSGPGIGRNTAAVFAEQGFKHIFLLSRDKSRLSEDASYISSKASGAKVEIQQLDVSADEASVKQALSQVGTQLEKAGVPLEVVLYNAARVAPSHVLKHEASELAVDIKITTISLYITLQWAVPKLLEAAKGSYNPAFLTTSGGLYREPEHFLFSLSASKASQYNLMHSFHKRYEPQLHVASISVMGVVSDEAKVTTARAIGEQFYKLYEQKKGTEGEVSVEMEDPAYVEQVQGMGKSLGY